MADRLVTGIAQTSDPSKLEEALCNKEPVDCERLAVITKDAPTPEHEESLLKFLHVNEPHETTDTDSEVLSGDVGILTDAGGVNVPGISADTRYVGFFAHPHVIDHLADWPIPGDQIDNYNDAIEAGRTVITYKSPQDDVPTVEQAFRDAGLKNVRTFDPHKG